MNLNNIMQEIVVNVVDDKPISATYASYTMVDKLDYYEVGDTKIWIRDISAHHRNFISSDPYLTDSIIVLMIIKFYLHDKDLLVTHDDYIYINCYLDNGVRMKVKIEFTSRFSFIASLHNLNEYKHKWISVQPHGDTLVEYQDYVDSMRHINSILEGKGILQLPEKLKGGVFDGKNYYNGGINYGEPFVITNAKFPIFKIVTSSDEYELMYRDNKLFIYNLQNNDYKYHLVETMSTVDNVTTLVAYRYKVYLATNVDYGVDVSRALLNIHEQ